MVFPEQLYLSTKTNIHTLQVIACDFTCLRDTHTCTRTHARTHARTHTHNKLIQRLYQEKTTREGMFLPVFLYRKETMKIINYIS